jgi:hypothetical protein
MPFSSDGCKQKEVKTIILIELNLNVNTLNVITVITGPPVTGRHKYRDLVLQVGGWTQGWGPCSVKEYCCEIQRSEYRMA